MDRPPNRIIEKMGILRLEFSCGGYLMLGICVGKGSGSSRLKLAISNKSTKIFCKQP